MTMYSSIANFVLTRFIFALLCAQNCQATKFNEASGTADLFGASVAILYESDAASLVVGAPGYSSSKGKIYIYSGTTFEVWSFSETLEGETAGDQFGKSVALNDEWTVVGAPGNSSNNGKVYCYFKVASGYSLKSSFTGPADSYFGSVVSLTPTHLAVGAPYENAGKTDNGAMHAYKLCGGAFEVIDTGSEPGLLSNDIFSTSIATDITFALIGSPGASSSKGSVRICSLSTYGSCGTAVVASDGSSGDQFGYSVAYSYANGFAVGAPYDDDGSIVNGGSVYVYDDASVFIVKLTASSPVNQDQFGLSLSVTTAGIEMYLVIGSEYLGANNYGLVSLYKDVFGSPVLNGTFVSPGDPADSNYGTAVSINTERFVVGASGYNGDEGAAYVYSFVEGGYEYSCSTGKETNANGNCIECDEGYYKSSIGSTCSGCPAGTFGYTIGLTDISDCPPCISGSYQSLTGQASCINCDAGKYGTVMASTTASDCTDCPVDSFSASTGSDECSLCGYGTCTNNLVGQTSCIDCSNLYIITSVSGCYDNIADGSTYDCPTAGGVELMILGSGLDFSLVSEASVTVGGSDCNVTAVGVGLVTCSLGEGVGLDLDVIVTKSSQGIAGSYSNLSYSSASIDSIHGCDDSEALPHENGTSACSRDGSDEVTVSGNNFGPNQASVLVGGVKATLVPLSSRGLSGWEQNTTIARVPSGSGLGVGVNVLQINGALSNSSRVLSYARCPVGTVNVLNEFYYYDCETCSQGKYNSQNESYNCIDCPAGSYCTSDSAYSCEDVMSLSTSDESSSSISDCYCPETLMQHNNLTQCTCNYGYEYDSSLGVCNECDLGKYKLQQSLGSCTSCPDSLMTTNLTASTSGSDCTCPTYFSLVSDECFCTAGYEYDAISRTCSVCPEGTYKSTVSNGACTSCPDSLMTTNLTASTSGSDCTCPSNSLLVSDECLCIAGYELSDSLADCDPCGSGFVKNSASQSFCQSCLSIDLHSVSDENKTSCVCDDGFVEVSSNPIVCIECDNGMICEGGATLASLVVVEGYWQESSTDLSTRSCFVSSACLGSDDTSQQCSKGHEGPLCAVCADGYTSFNAFSPCVKCFDDSHSQTFMAALIVLVACLAIAALVYFADIFHVGQLVDRILSFFDIRSVRVRLKVVLSYFQIVSQFQIVLTSAFPDNYSGFLSTLEVSNFNLATLLSPSCFYSGYDFYDELLGKTLFPMAIGVFILLGYMVPMITRKGEQHLETIVNFYSWIFLSCFIFFPSASTAVFQMFSCDDDFESGKSYLKADYRFYALLMMLVYPIGIPIFFFINLLSKRKVLLSSRTDLVAFVEHAQLESKTISDLFRSNLRQLLNDFNTSLKTTIDDEESFIFLRRLRKQIFRRLAIESACCNSNSMAHAPLFEAYRPEAWYWECVECVRRLSLTGLLVFMYPGSEKQILLAMIVCMLWIIIYSWKRPYLNPSHNDIMMSAQWGILLQLYGIFLLVNDTFSFQVSASSLGSLMITTGVTFALFQVFRTDGIIKMLNDFKKHLGSSEKEHTCMLWVINLAIGCFDDSSKQGEAYDKGARKSSSKLIVTKHSSDEIEMNTNPAYGREAKA